MTCSQTVASFQRQKPPLAYSGMLRKMTARMKQLQEEFALESVTNIEFEESSRRSFEFLTGQVKSLKEAFSTLTETLLEEIEHLGGAMRGEIFRIEDRQQKMESGMMGNMNIGEKLGRQVEQLAKDLDAVLGVVPKIEDSMLRSSAHVQERLDTVSHQAGKACGDVEFLQSKVRSIESELRQELEQKSLKLQRSVTLQLESMSRALIRESDRPTGFGSATPGGFSPSPGGPGFGSQLPPTAGSAGPPFSSQLPAPGHSQLLGSYMPSPSPGVGSFTSQPSFGGGGGGYNAGGNSPQRSWAQNASQHDRSFQQSGAGGPNDSFSAGPAEVSVNHGHLKVDFDLTGLESPSGRTSRLL